MHISSLAKMDYFVKKYLAQYADKALKILDIGSQDVNGTYKPVFENDHWEYIGCDMVSGKNVDILLKNAYDWCEIESASLDIVITGQTFEHIEYPWITIFEIARVLKPEGICCIIAPSSGPEHKYPVDCWRIYPDGFKALAKFACLEVIEAFVDLDGKYLDDSDVWHDSVLIARKSIMTEDQKDAFQIKNAFLKSMVG
ncbi:MAG TPA: methyltransferase domain-containing protein [Selenomonadales bacterium]|nr:methyltransferase domain-containing protein [Selenomonadales bacterium]